MALADIKAKIIREAEQEANKLLAKAARDQAERIKQAKAELARGRTELVKKLEDKVARAVEQNRMLFKLEATKALLSAKRGHLDQLAGEVEKAVSQDTSLLQKYFAKVLSKVLIEIGAEHPLNLEVSAADEAALKKALAALALKAEVLPRKAWPQGRLLLQLGRSSIDLSLSLFLSEEIKIREKELAETLFS